MTCFDASPLRRVPLLRVFRDRGRRVQRGTTFSLLLPQQHPLHRAHPSQSTLFLHLITYIQPLLHHKPRTARVASHHSRVSTPNVGQSESTSKSRSLEGSTSRRSKEDLGGTLQPSLHYNLTRWRRVALAPQQTRRENQDASFKRVEYTRSTVS